MSFSTKLSESFGKVLEQSEYQVQDPLVKVQHVPKGNNIVFGRTLKDTNYSELIYIGKVLETTSGKSYLGADAWLDVTFPHVVYITGTRGSGKSFDLGVIIEGLSQLQRSSPIQNCVTPTTSILIDTQSQFWTLAFEPRSSVPANQTQLEDLRTWKIRPNAVDSPVIYVPPGTQTFLGNERTITIRPNEITHAEWCGLLGQEVYSPQGHVLGATLEALAPSQFEVRDMISHISDDSHWPNVAESSRNAIVYKLEDYQRTGLFSRSGLDVRKMLVPGRTNILMLRELRNVDKSLITSVLARQLFTIMGRFHNDQKVAQFFNTPQSATELPQKVWLIIDEAHVVAPRGEVSPARDALIEYVKRGRDAGLSLVLATQQPAAVDDRILSQVNLTFNHRLTFQSDISAAISRIPTKTIRALRLRGTTLTEFSDMVRVLESGQCFVGDHGTSRVVMLQVRPRVSAHGGYSPI